VYIFKISGGVDISGVAFLGLIIFAFLGLTYNNVTVHFETRCKPPIVYLIINHVYLDWFHVLVYRTERCFTTGGELQMRAWSIHFPDSTRYLWI